MKKEDFRFFIEFPVRFSDVDSLGHVNNAVYLSYFEEARVHYFRNLIKLQFDNKPSLSIIVLEIKCAYRSPAYFGETLRAYSKVSWMRSKSTEMQYLITDVETGRKVADGSSILVAYDYQAGQSITIPDDIRKAIIDFEGINI
ncbi:MAG: acyl-CoA thioesterase [Bacteroidetes bacterium]|nr:acyl-CoA thioesterase [Bacteroidota bacterium]